MLKIYVDFVAKRAFSKKLFYYYFTLGRGVLSVDAGSIG